MFSECASVQEKWTGDYCRLSVNGKALCLTCSGVTAVLKECNIPRLCSSKLKQNYKY